MLRFVYRSIEARDTRALTGGRVGSMDVRNESDLLENPNRVPVKINFIPLQPVSGRDGVSVMIVVPPVSETQQRHPPIVG